MHIINFQKNLSENLVFISGPARSGKSLFCPVISSLKKTQNFQMINEIEEILRLNHIRAISDKSLKYLVQINFNIKIYDNFIGRNFNFKKKEWTSISRYLKNKMINKILSTDHGLKNIKSIKKTKVIFPFMIHDGILFFKNISSIYKKAKFIHIKRHPIDLIYSWVSKYVGESFNKKDPRKGYHNFLTLYNKKFDIPFWLKNEKENYKKIKGSKNRIIFSTYCLYKEQLKIYKDLEKKKKNSIFIVNFDNFVLFPDQELKKICKFVNTKKSDLTKKILLEERCPRKLFRNERQKKFNFLNKDISTKSKNLLRELINFYNQKQNL